MLGHGEWKDVFRAVQDGDTGLVGLYLKLNTGNYNTGVFNRIYSRKHTQKNFQCSSC